MTPAASRNRMRSPGVVAEWVERWSGRTIDVVGEDLVDAALTALEAAVRRPGRERAAAEALLAADALLTWRVEDAAGADDPERELEALLRAVLDRGRDGRPSTG